MTKVILASLLFLLSIQAHAKAEAEYALEHCNTINGITEFTLEDKTRVDCLTPRDAIEYDFTNKWYECISQALYYRMHTGRQAVCGLIHKNGTTIESEHVDRALDTVKHYNLPVYIFEIK